MAWTEPKDWQVDELLTASDLNTHLRDNLDALKSPPAAQYEMDEASDYTLSSTGTWTDIDSTNLSHTIETAGGRVKVHFHGNIETDGRVSVDIAVDGVRVGGDDGIARNPASGQDFFCSFTRRITGLSAGSHTFKLQWYLHSGGSTAKLYAGAGTSGFDVHGQFWVEEG